MPGLTRPPDTIHGTVEGLPCREALELCYRSVMARMHRADKIPGPTHVIVASLEAFLDHVGGPTNLVRAVDGWKRWKACHRFEILSESGSDDYQSNLI
jgi:hypothetical protein